MVLMWLGITLFVYVLAKKLYRQVPNILLSPVLICPIILIVILQIFGASYESYDSGGHFLSAMLQPATVALAVPMYKHRKMIIKYLPEILLCVVGGALMAIVTSMGIAEAVGLPEAMVDSLALRAITTPLAISVSQILGGNPAMTAVFVVITGLLGTIMTSVIQKCLNRKNSIATGMMFGISAHGIGTSKAHEAGHLEGAISSLAMIFMGIITAFIAPGFIPLCHELLRKFVH
ncbi:LrgB family protein [Propionispora vibrioides]|jgi:predicted murein hydrolase (TIGR00659 family)|uniref:TIGR00659 family protein n=1 Tax=Propionispora vibrioides TaxID=112903 RepID=A0A1H8QDA2_9FIRM|nr:LrgB family protein [Propionispora vibrioides]SEO51897.1 TIGR00659 family protein [Propionispora vibrioides]